MGDTQTDETLAKLASELEQKLLKLPIYREFLAVKKALAEIRDRPTGLSDSAALIANSAYMLANTTHSVRYFRLGRTTAMGAALQALKEAGRPMSIHELVEAVQKIGFTFGGKKPPASALAAYFAKPGPKSRIVSIYIDNKPHWWFRDMPVPGAKIT